MVWAGVLGKAGALIVRCLVGQKVGFRSTLFRATNARVSLLGGCSGLATVVRSPAPRIVLLSSPSVFPFGSVFFHVPAVGWYDDFELPQLTFPRQRTYMQPIVIEVLVG